MGRYTDMLRKRLRNPLPTQTVTAITEGLAAREKAVLKGQFDGNCNRTACQAPLVRHGIGENWWNSSTQAYYCTSCARLLNRESQRFEAIEICTYQTDPSSRPAYPYDQTRSARQAAQQVA